VTVTDPATGLLPTNLVQGGVAVSWLTADANSRYSFTCDVPGVVVDFGAGAEALYANEVPGLAIAAGGATNTAIDARMKWAPATAYILGQQVLSPNSDVVKANVAHTSAGAYATDVAKWDLSTTFGTTAVVAGKVDKGALVLNVKDYGAVGDGTTDDTAAIQAAIDAVPGTTSLAGATILFPYGQYRVTSQITIAMPGVHLMASGGFTALILPDAAMTGVVFRFAIASTFVRGPRVTNLRISMNGSAAGALLFEGAYDNAILENVFVDGMTGTAAGIKFTNAAGATTDVSQTITATNCYVAGATGYTGKAWHLERVQEAVFTSCKGLGGGEGSGTSWYLRGCRGVAFYGCSAAVSAKGWDLDASVTAMVGITISSPTIEGVTNTITTTGTQLISGLTLTNPRAQIASTIAAGPILLNYVSTSQLETKAILVTVASTCSQVHLLTEDVTKITDSGSYTSMILWQNAAARMGLRGSTGVSLFVGAVENARVVNAGSAQTGLMLTANPTGAGAVLTTVLIGAVDSGGVGYRLLRVPNTP